MESVILALISVLILFPILYFLPIGLTSKGKMIVVFGSLCIAMFGLMAQTSFGVWQSVSLLIILVALMAYLLVNRAENFIFQVAGQAQLADEVKEDPINSDTEQFEMIANVEELLKKETMLVETISVVEEPLEEESSLPIEVAEEELPLIDFGEEIVPVADVKLEDRNEIEELLASAIDSMSIDDQETDFLENRTHDHLSEIHEQPLEEIDSALNYMEEIESLLENDSVPLIEQTPALQEVEEGTESILNAHEWELLEKENDEISMDPFETMDENFESENPILTSEADQTETTLQFEEQEEYVKPSSHFQQQMMSNLTAQLSIARKSMPSLEYEYLVKQHMQPSLSHHHYYTFAALLMEHYLHTKEYNKLEALLEELKDSYANYQILSLEIQYLIEKFIK